jgi:pyruvate dehydrogenase E1 component alpha subunit
MMDSRHKVHITPVHLKHLLHEMLRIRRFEERCAELYKESKIRGFLHLYIGEEAIAVGVMQSLTPEDAIIASYREHGHALARGIPMAPIMAEMFGKQTGCSGGRGGSMHLFDNQTRFYGGNAIVAGSLPLAVGIALADKMQRKNSVSCCFFGEGAVAEGEFHESLNLATLWQLPVLFVCENNRYAMGTPLDIEESQPKIHLKAASYGLNAQVVDGMNVVEVESAARQAVDAIREGHGPQFLECQTYRFRGHSMFDTQLYRDAQEVEQWKAKGPVVQLTQWMNANGQLSPTELAQMESDIDAEIEAAVQAAEVAPWEGVETLMQHIYTEPRNG